MNNFELAQKYANKYLKAEEKWNYVLDLLEVCSDSENIRKLKFNLEKGLKKLTKADKCECYFEDFDMNLNGEIVTFIESNGIPIGKIVLKSKDKNFERDNLRFIKIVTGHLALMYENILLINNLKRDNEEKMNFLASVSHEFKTPLNSIKGFAEILLEDSVTINKKYLKNIINSSNFLLMFVHDILDVIRSSYTKLELNKKIIDPNPLISEVLESFELKFKNKNLNIHSTFVSCKIKVDATRFRQVVYNYISNAVKFNKNGGDINIITYIDEKKRYVFEITDTGCGIARKDFSKIFGFFSQVGNRLHRKMGSGVGLSLVKAIVEAHGGTVGFDSKFNKGSTFWFSVKI